MLLLLLVFVTQASGLSSQPGVDASGIVNRRMNNLYNLGGSSSSTSSKTNAEAAPLTPEEREKEWAARIIEQHEQMRQNKKPSGYQQPVRRIGQAAPSLVVDEAAQRKPAQKQKIQRGRTTLIPETAQRSRDEGLDPAVLLDVFDGQLGRLRLALRSSSDAMLSVSGDFQPAEPTDEDGVLVLRSATGVECVLDARRVQALEFTQRDGDSHVGDQYAVTLKRHDNLSFLSALLGGATIENNERVPIAPEAIDRWHHLQNTYGT